MYFSNKNYIFTLLDLFYDNFSLHVFFIDKFLLHNITEFLFHDNIYINYITKSDICATSILHI